MAGFNVLFYLGIRICSSSVVISRSMLKRNSFISWNYRYDYKAIRPFRFFLTPMSCVPSPTLNCGRLSLQGLEPTITWPGRERKFEYFLFKIQILNQTCFSWDIISSIRQVQHKIYFKSLLFIYFTFSNLNRSFQMFKYVLRLIPIKFSH